MSQPIFNCKLQVYLFKFDYRCISCKKTFQIEDLIDGIQECGKEESCKAVQYSDQMYCDRCGLVWDINDPDPPICGYKS